MSTLGAEEILAQGQPFSLKRSPTMRSGCCRLSAGRPRWSQSKKGEQEGEQASASSVVADQVAATDDAAAAGHGRRHIRADATVINTSVCGESWGGAERRHGAVRQSAAAAGRCRRPTPLGIAGVARDAGRADRARHGRPPQPVGAARPGQHRRPRASRSSQAEQRGPVTGWHHHYQRAAVGVTARTEQPAAASARAVPLGWTPAKLGPGM